MKGKAVNWEEDRLKLLKDIEVAREYIEACLEEGISLPVALADVVKAQGMTQVARKTHMALPNLMRAVKKGSNPTYDTLSRLLTGMGMSLTVRPMTSRRQAKAVR
jgi:probable addiction module antidote protein